MNQKKALKSVLFLSILSIILFSYLVSIHYKEESSFCDISTGVSCDIVNKSVYSEIFGIPVALLGALTFVFVGLLCLAALKNKTINIFSLKLKQKDTLKLLLFILVISTLFALYLIYAELYLILSICLLCVASDILILLSLFILIDLNKKNLDPKIINTIRVLAILTALIVLYLVYKILLEV